MRFADEFGVLIVAGGWNKNIFIPEWVSKYLLTKEELKVEITLSGVGASFRISSKKVRIFAFSDKLNFVPISKTDENLGFIQELGLKTADYLPHTPVTAFGINFLFEEKMNKRLSELLTLGDKERLDQFGSKVKRARYKHGLEFDGRLINLTISIDDQKALFDFNFHFNISSLVQFKEEISNNSIIDQKKTALKLMRDVYDLELADEEME